jgi:predicted ABC-type ATPase
MFAGPNGSGKSTLKSHLPAKLLGIYLNPDEIEQAIRRQGWLELAPYGVGTNADEVLSFFSSSEFLKEVGCGDVAGSLAFIDGRLDFSRVVVNAYLASAVVDFLRGKLLRRISFTFETVMSHRSKVEVLQRAQLAGYRTYLYFVATDDPTINISRVRNRKVLGGHPVPEGKIVARYHRSLDLLIEAIRHTNRAYIFDNSGDNLDHEQTWLAEITDGRRLELKAGTVPAWFARSVLDKVA